MHVGHFPFKLFDIVTCNVSWQLNEPCYLNHWSCTKYLIVLYIVYRLWGRRNNSNSFSFLLDNTEDRPRVRLGSRLMYKRCWKMLIHVPYEICTHYVVSKASMNFTRKSWRTSKPGRWRFTDQFIKHDRISGLFFLIWTRLNTVLRKVKILMDRISMPVRMKDLV